SFAHGGNDGQKGMGLIMLILIGAAPTAYALNRTMQDSAMPAFEQSATGAETVFAAHAGGTQMAAPQARHMVRAALRQRDAARPEVYSALAAMSGDIRAQVQRYGAISHVPAAATPNLRNDMYMVSDAIGLIKKSSAASTFAADEMKALSGFKSNLE